MRKINKFLFILFITIASFSVANCGYVLVALGLTPAEDTTDYQSLNAMLYLLLSKSDTTSPTPGSKGTILLEDTSGSLKLTWAQASDNETAAADIQYKIVYSTTNNLDTVDDAEANGTVAQDWTSNWTWEKYKTTTLQVTTFTPSGLSSGSQYYFNIIIKDTAENKAIYTSNGDSVIYSYGITTLAGNGNGSFTGDGGAATSATLNNPYGVYVDSSSNIYIADTFNYRIRKIDSGGTMSTIAGTGSSGYTGDSGAATSATLKLPRDVYVDSSGNVYIADTGNHAIRKITGSTISTIAGTGSGGYSGDGGAATSAQLQSPYSVYGDSSNNLYIADLSNDRIRKIVGTTISTIAGTGTGGYSGDGGAATSANIDTAVSVSVDSSGNVYFAEYNNSVIRKIDTSNNISTVVGTGTKGYSGDKGAATSAQINQPYGVAVDSSGNIFISDTYNSRIRRIDVSSGNIYTIAGNGKEGFTDDSDLSATTVPLYRPRGLYVDSAGNVYFADTGNQRIRKLTPNF
ncbi:MAG: hypothetical protein H7A23_24580 [Leptospiraceae bacterium]|nr:hypothetical protein [Leptospiraceae bacterium]MCP5497742.1 hypothetical protein [Leptospiraceae bacterium]